ncbi:MAG: hypothetical protein LBU32_13620 [Clostridiales bacterium]|jgi:hypothetical protein|nr:hypothetical protein [Clostridiales bacterium]
MEFEAAALEAEPLLQGGAAASICAGFMQGGGSLQLLRNLPPKGEDESGTRQKQGCGFEAFGKSAGKLGKSLPGESFGAAMDSPAPARLRLINASTAAGFPQPDSKAATATPPVGSASLLACDE